MADDVPCPGMREDESEISDLLAGWTNRDFAARDRLVATVYEELRRLARH